MSKQLVICRNFTDMFPTLLRYITELNLRCEMRCQKSYYIFDQIIEVALTVHALVAAGTLASPPAQVMGSWFLHLADGRGWVFETKDRPAPSGSSARGSILPVSYPEA